MLLGGVRAIFRQRQKWAHCARSIWSGSSSGTRSGVLAHKGAVPLFRVLHRAFAALPSKLPADFQGLYCDLDRDFPDEDFKSLWYRIEQSHRVKKAVDVVKDWDKQGNELSTELMSKIIFRLCYHAWYKEASKLLAWLQTEKGYNPEAELDELLRLDIACRAGNSKNEGQAMFDRLSRKTEGSYLILLQGLASDLCVKVAKDVLMELKNSKLMTTGRGYAIMLRLLFRQRHFHDALQTFKEYEESGLPPEAEIYWMLLKNKDEEAFKSLPVVEKAEAALEKMTLGRLNRRDILKMYGELGRAEEVDRVWTEIKASPPVSMPEHLAGIESYDLIGDVESAEEVSKMLEEQLAGDTARDHCLSMLRMYARNGRIDKAEALCECMELRGFEGDFEECEPLVAAYLKQGDVDKAVECFNRYAAKGRDGRKPYSHLKRCILQLLDVYIQRKDVDGATQLLSAVPSVSAVAIFHSLMRVYLAAGRKPEFSFRKRMAAAGMPVNTGDTRALLQQVESMDTAAAAAAAVAL